MAGLTKIDFHGATLLAIAGDSAATTLIAMKPLFEGAGVDWSAQRKRILRHPVLSKGVVTMATPSDGGPQDALFLPLDRVDFALATVHPDRVKDPRARDNLILYQTEVCHVLHDHFHAQRTGRKVTLRDVGGVVKAVTHKELLESEARSVAKLIELENKVIKLAESYDPTKSTSILFKQMVRILEDEGVSSKGRRSLTQRCSKLMNKMAIRDNRQAEVRLSNETGKLLFHVDLARDWVKIEGSTIIRAHKDKIAGQSVLNLIAPEKPREKAA